MVSALGLGLSGSGLCTGRGAESCSWARHFNLIVPLFTQEYKRLPGNLMPLGDLVMD